MAADPRPAPGLRARWLRWRDRRIANPAFQRWAARFPLTRPFVRRRATTLHDLMAGFVYSQVLASLVELDVPARLTHGPMDAASLARAMGLNPVRAEQLLRAATAIDVLVRERDGRYRLSQTGAALAGAPGVAEMVRHHALFYADLADPVALLRDEVPETALSRYWSYVGTGGDGQTAESYSNLMAASQAMVAAETLAAYPLRAHGRLLDIGGGSGAFLAAAMMETPGLAGTLFDLPDVAPLATRRFAELRLSDRVEVVGGSFLDDPLPRGADIASLVRVLYDHDDATVARVLAAAYAALPPGGTLLLSEPMSGGDRPTRAGDAYFAFYTLAMTSGRPRTVAEHTDALHAAGFRDVRQRPTHQSFITQVITARRP